MEKDKQHKSNRFVETDFMDTLIRLRPEELTEDFFYQLKRMAETANQIEIKINKSDAVNGLSETEIKHRLQQLEQQQVTSFSLNELEAYTQRMGS